MVLACRMVNLKARAAHGAAILVEWDHAPLFRHYILEARGDGGSWERLSRAQDNSFEHRPDGPRSASSSTGYRRSSTRSCRRRRPCWYTIRAFPGTLAGGRSRMAAAGANGRPAAPRARGRYASACLRQGGAAAPRAPTRR